MGLHSEERGCDTSLGTGPGRREKKALGSFSCSVALGHPLNSQSLLILTQKREDMVPASQGCAKNKANSVAQAHMGCKMVFWGGSANLTLVLGWGRDPPEFKFQKGLVKLFLSPRDLGVCGRFGSPRGSGAQVPGTT